MLKEYCLSLCHTVTVQKMPSEYQVLTPVGLKGGCKVYLTSDDEDGSCDELRLKTVTIKSNGDPSHGQKTSPNAQRNFLNTPAAQSSAFPPLIHIPINLQFINNC